MVEKLYNKGNYYLQYIISDMKKPMLPYRRVFYKLFYQRFHILCFMLVCGCKITTLFRDKYNFSPLIFASTPAITH